jgi:hypothetical protein
MSSRSRIIIFLGNGARPARRTDNHPGIAFYFQVHRRRIVNPLSSSIEACRPACEYETTADMCLVAALCAVDSSQVSMFHFQLAVFIVSLHLSKKGTPQRS